MYLKPGIPHYRWMAPVLPPRPLDFDELMRHLTVVGFVGLAAWVAAGSAGILAGYLTISPFATLRFLLAILILVFARRTYWELVEWRWRRFPADERYGFANPLSQRSRSGEFLSVSEGDVEVEATTGSPHPQR
jgi:hypothetical protein